MKDLVNSRLLNTFKTVKIVFFPAMLKFMHESTYRQSHVSSLSANYPMLSSAWICWEQHRLKTTTNYFLVWKNLGIRAKLRSVMLVLKLMCWSICWWRIPWKQIISYCSLLNIFINFRSDKHRNFVEEFWQTNQNFIFKLVR